MKNPKASASTKGIIIAAFKPKSNSSLKIKKTMINNDNRTITLSPIK